MKLVMVFDTTVKFIVIGWILLCDTMHVQYLLWHCICASVCPSIRLSQASSLSKWLNTSSRKHHRMIAWALKFSVVKDMGEYPMGSLPTGVPNTGGVG